MKVLRDDTQVLRKHIYDYLFQGDGSDVEVHLAKAMEMAEEVVVYAKLRRFTLSKCTHAAGPVNGFGFCGREYAILTDVMTNKWKWCAMAALAACAVLAAEPDRPLVATVRPDGTRTVSVTVNGRSCALPDGSSAVRGQAVTEDGGYALFTHNLARYHLPATQMDRGWMNAAALSVFDAKSGRRLNTVLLDDPLVGAANPWGVAVNASWIAVAHAGTHEMSLVPRAAFFEKLLGLKEEASADLGFMRAVGRKRVALKGKGPREIRFRPDGKLEVKLHFAETTAVVDPETGTVDETELPEGLSDAVRTNPARKGEHYFNDATVCFQKWQSCASCHPDGRTDGLTWDFPFSGGGLGHSELTPDLTKLRRFMTRRTRQGDFHILLYDASQEIGDAVDAYVRSLAPAAEAK